MFNIFKKKPTINIDKSRIVGLTLSDIWQSGDPIGVGSYNVESAKKISAVRACVRVIAECCAMLPLFVYERVEAGKEKAVEHPLYTLLHDRPNRYQTSYEWRDQLVSDCLYYGNAFCLKKYKSGFSQGRSQVIDQLIPLSPVGPEARLNADGTLSITVADYDGKRKEYRQSELFWIKGLPRTASYLGDPVLQDSSDTVNAAANANRYSASLFESGGGKRVALVLPEGVFLTPEDEARLRSQWDAAYRGNAKTAVLSGGIKAEQVGMTADEAQCLDSTKFLVSEIARLFRVPPHLIGDLERATFSNISEQDLAFAKYTLAPWLKRFEESIQRDLIQEDRFMAEHEMMAFLQADPVKRAAWYTSLKQQGIATTNEIRPLENLNKHPDGDVLWQPVNMVPAGTDIMAVKQPQPDGTDDTSKEKSSNSETEQ